MHSVKSLPWHTIFQCMPFDYLPKKKRSACPPRQRTSPRHVLTHARPPRFDSMLQWDLHSGHSYAPHHQAIIRLPLLSWGESLIWLWHGRVVWSLFIVSWHGNRLGLKTLEYINNILFVLSVPFCVRQLSFYASDDERTPVFWEWLMVKGLLLALAVVSTVDNVQRTTIFWSNSGVSVANKSLKRETVVVALD